MAIIAITAIWFRRAFIWRTWHSGGFVSVEYFPTSILNDYVYIQHNTTILQFRKRLIYISKLADTFANVLFKLPGKPVYRFAGTAVPPSPRTRSRSPNTNIYSDIVGLFVFASAVAAAQSNCTRCMRAFWPDAFIMCGRRALEARAFTACSSPPFGQRSNRAPQSSSIEVTYARTDADTHTLY